MSEIGDFSKPLSRAIAILCQGYITNFKSYAFKIKEIIPEAVTTNDVINNFVNFNLKLLKDPEFNSMWKNFEDESFQGFALVTPKKVEVELYPHTFICSNNECRQLHYIERIPSRKVLCQNCNSPLKQFNLVLVCRNCGALKEIFTKCPWCFNPIKVNEQFFSLHWECTNPNCNASDLYEGKKKINAYMRRFDRTINTYKRPSSHLCLNVCHETESRMDWPWFQTRPREKIFSSYQDKLVIYKKAYSKIEEIFPSKEDMQARGFEDISAGTLEIHSFVFGYTRFAKFEDRLKEGKLRITPFTKEGGGVNIYYNKIETSGIRLKLFSDPVNEIAQEYAKSELFEKNRGVTFILNEVKAEWNNISPEVLEEKGFSVNGTDIIEEAAKRILLHTIKHALLVVAPRFCGLDYGEVGGYFKTPGMLREGDRLLEDYSIYIYDNTNYGSGVTFSLASKEAFLRLLDDPRDSARTRLECLRNKCNNACRACLYLPHTVCSKINLGLDRNLAKQYFETVERNIKLF